MPLSIDIRTIARVRAVAWEDGEWGIVWETRDGRRGSERIGSRSDAEAIVIAVIGGGLQPAGGKGEDHAECRYMGRRGPGAASTPRLPD